MIDPTDGHSEQYRPLAAYGALTVAFNAGFGGALVAMDRTGRLPDRFAPADVGLLAVATFKLSRLIAKDRVTSAIRAPFTRFQDDAGHGEVDEAARGRGLRRALGELLVCDYCLAQWVAGGLVVLQAGAPRIGRTVTTTYTVYALSDLLQLAWTRYQDAG